MLYAALDSSAGLSFAVADSKEELTLVIHHQIACEMGRHTEEQLLHCVREPLKEMQIKVSDIACWTVGTGPGSYVGLRNGIAFVQGICRASKARCRGLPSSLAVANTLVKRALPGQYLAVLHDGRRGELILTKYTVSETGLQAVEDPQVVRPEQVKSVLKEFDWCVTPHCEPVRKVFQEQNVEIPLHESSVDAAEFLTLKGWQWPENDEQLEQSLEPVYVRPAVFTRTSS